MPDVSGHDLPTDVLACIELCVDCHKACTQTAMHCLQTGGEHAEASHLRLMLDCAQICQTSADFMMRGSDLHEHVCRACAEVCRRCAADCERLAGDDNRMAACAEQCRRCADSCEQMSRGHARGMTGAAAAVRGDGRDTIARSDPVQTRGRSTERASGGRGAKRLTGRRG